MPKFLTEADAWEAEGTVVVPTDGDVRNAASVELAFQQLTNRTLYLYNYVDGGAESRVLILSIFQSFFDQSDWSINGGSSLGNISASVELYVPLNRIVPVGATVTRCRAMVNPGAARGVGDRMELSLVERVPDFAAVPSFSITESTIDSEEDDGTSNVQMIDVSGLSYVMAPASHATLQLAAGNGTGDLVYAFEVSYDGAGPRSA